MHLKEEYRRRGSLHPPPVAPPVQPTPPPPPLPGNPYYVSIQVIRGIETAIRLFCGLVVSFVI